MSTLEWTDDTANYPGIREEIQKEMDEIEKQSIPKSTQTVTAIHVKKIQIIFARKWTFNRHRNDAHQSSS